MRRLLSALFILFGFWFVASVVFAAVSHFSVPASFLYLLGAVVIVPIPIMLVLLFALMQRGLRSEAAPVSPTAGVVAAVARAFSPDERAEALAIVAAYGATPDEPQRTAVQEAIVRLSGGDLDRLRYFTDQANADYGDVLAWDAEQPGPHGV